MIKARKTASRRAWVFPLGALLVLGLVGQPASAAIGVYTYAGSGRVYRDPDSQVYPIKMSWTGRLDSCVGTYCTRAPDGRAVIEVGLVREDAIVPPLGPPQIPVCLFRPTRGSISIRWSDGTKSIGGISIQQVNSVYLVEGAISIGRLKDTSVGGLMIRTEKFSNPCAFERFGFLGRLAIFPDTTAGI